MQTCLTSWRSFAPRTVTAPAHWNSPFSPRRVRTKRSKRVGRPRRRGMDDPGRPNEGRARASRPARACGPQPTEADARSIPQKHLGFPRIGQERNAVGHGVVDDTPAHEAHQHHRTRISVHLPRLGGGANSVRARDRRAALAHSIGDKTEAAYGAATRWRGGAS